ncbi:MAG: hypothetical protein KGM44_06300 [bacterium]|nr:hypothetical protein [bacterium]
MDDPQRYDYLFFPVGLNLRGRRCVVIGDDREAVEKEEALREAGAEVVRLRDPSQVGENDLAGAFFVISTPQDAELSARMRAYAERHRFLLCCIDQPVYGFVAMQAVAKSGPVRVAISTGGVSPAVGSTMRRALSAALDERFARFMACLQAIRRRVRGESQAEERKQRMRDAAAGFTVEVAVTYPAWFTGAEASQGPNTLPPSR